MGGPPEPTDALQIGEFVHCIKNINPDFAACHGYVVLHAYHAPAKGMRYAVRGFHHQWRSFSNEELLRAGAFCRSDLRRCIWTFHGIVLLE